jgi:hypothetical protein
MKKKRLPLYAFVVPILAAMLLLGHLTRRAREAEARINDAMRSHDVATAPRVPVAPPTAVAAPEPPAAAAPEAAPAADARLVGWILDAMYAWNAPKRQQREDEADARARYASIAEDIGAEISAEPPLFAGDDDRRHTAALVASVAFWESAFALYVDRGDCLDPTWRRTDFGHAMVVAHADCDGMAAGSMWQIHGGHVFDGKMLPEPYALAHDRRLAVRTALRMMRYDTSLTAYTGEKPGSGYPKAKQRRGLADRYWRAHPFAPLAE